MPSSNEIIEQLKSTQTELAATVLENSSIKSNIMLGPMDDETPWTSSGQRIVILREKVRTLTFQLGEQTYLERG